MSNRKNQQFQAVVGEKTYDIQFKKGELLLNGTPVDYQFERIAPETYTLLFNGQSYPVVIESNGDHETRIAVDGHAVTVHVKDERALLLERFGLNDTDQAASRAVKAPMPGLVLNVMVAPGQEVQLGDGLVVLEAMKMENELRAQNAGVVKAIHVSPGDAVSKNALLLEFEA